jgi:hypothetical protein
MPPPLFPLAGERVSSEEPAPPAAAEPPRAAPTSWWRALLASAVPPAPEAGVPAALPHALRLRVAAIAAGLGLLAFVVAFAVGFHGPPADLLMSSSVAASIVLGHAIMGAGLLVVGLGLLRAAERLAFAAPSGERDDRRRDG